MKPVFIISCPIDTFSGYGSRSRSVVKSIIESDKYNVKIISQKWGSTSLGYIENHKEWEFLSQYIIDAKSITQQPEIWCQITIPSEFQNLGKYNIGITAGIETTHVDVSWVNGVNKMDLTLVSSNFSKKSFLDSVYTNNTTGEEIKVIKPIEVLPEEVDLNIFLNPSETFDLSSIKEEFCFLFLGHWLWGEDGHDRKNVYNLIKLFYNTFKNKPNKPALILKTFIGSDSYLDQEKILEKISKIRENIKSSDLPKIYLIHGDLSESQIASLYHHPKVKSMISLTRGEGWGRPLLEFSLTKKPIIASNWSGHLDFLQPKFNPLIPGGLIQVHPSCVVKNIIIKESKWFEPDYVETSKIMKNVYKHYKKYLDGAKQQAHYSKNNFAYSNLGIILNKILDKNIPDFPKEVELKLPELNLPKLKPIKL
jgi:hypothetical protein